MTIRLDSTRPFFAPLLGFLLALIIVYTGFVNTLIAFLLVGAIPGTLMSISPTLMLLFFVATSCLALRQLWNENRRYNKPSLES